MLARLALLHAAIFEGVEALVAVRGKLAMAAMRGIEVDALKRDRLTGAVVLVRVEIDIQWG